MSYDDSKRGNYSKKRVLPIDPLEVTESLGFQTYRKGARKPWTKEEDAELSNLVSKELEYGRDLESLDWDRIAETISPDGLRKSKDCRKRWSNSLDPALRKGKWTPEEDDLLVKAFEKFGSAWLKVAQEIKGRTDDQCAKRYVEILDPKTKDRLKPWTEEEDLLLIKQVKRYGTKWRTICNAFESRPSLTCRNRWRKLVTEVVRGKASSKIKEEVESVTNGNSSSVLETLNRQQEELVNNSMDFDARGSIKRRKTSVGVTHTTNSQFSTNQNKLSTKSEIEWLYSIEQSSQDHLHLNAQSKKPHVGEISDRETVRLLVEYAKAHGVGISLHQHIHHHYSQGSQNQHNELTSPGSSTSGTQLLEPEEQISRFQHFNYLPPMTQIPKLNSSTDQKSSNDTTQHYHHHHHHHHHTESAKEKRSIQRNNSHREGFTGDNDLVKESNLQRLLNADEFSGGHMGSNPALNSNPNPNPNPNPLTPLTQAVEIVRAADVASYANGGGFSGNDFSANHKGSVYDPRGRNAQESPELWELTKTSTHHKRKSHRNSYIGNDARRSSQTSAQTQPQDNVHDLTRTHTTNHDPLQYARNASHGENANSQFQSRFSENNEEDGEEEVLARELEETGIDEDVLNSYGLFYNVYTKEGSTFPDAQPNQQPQLQNTYGQNGNAYDQWGSDFIIPFNPS